MGDELRTVEETYHLDLLQVSCGNHLVATATVRIKAPGGREIVDVHRHRPSRCRLQSD